ncbi:YjcQ family protein [Streptobacillus moniliformis]|uniref:YjcQ family protein n=1 Tax=Streptobacillus moniliformis TaxID=34105 RepID=UPI0009C17EA2
MFSLFQGIIYCHIFHTERRYIVINHTKNYFKILKTIDYCYIHQINLEFDLEKLNITHHQLGLYLHNLINKNLIEGVIFSEALNSNGYEAFFLLNPVSLTFDGMMYLENNSEMKNFYNTLKEARDWLVAIKPF